MSQSNVPNDNSLADGLGFGTAQPPKMPGPVPPSVASAKPMIPKCPRGECKDSPIYETAGKYRCGGCGRVLEPEGPQFRTGVASVGGLVKG